jgi:nucleotide-binding universal stress UspA family protein
MASSCCLNIAAWNVLIRHEEAHMIVLKQILVATDFSEPSEGAINYGRDLSRAYNATLHVIHVIEDIPAFYGPTVGFPLAEVERNVEAAVQRDLDSTIAKHDDGTLNIVTAIGRGSNAAHAITEYAKTHAIDLIIVGTHGRGAVSRFLMGSVAERVVRSSPCPVLTVHAPERDVVDATIGEESPKQTATPVPAPVAG